MRTAHALLALLLVATLAPAPTPAAATGAVDLRITEILSDPDSTQGQREFIEVWNAGNATVEMQGWKVRDAPTASGSTNTFTFPAWSLRPNGRVVVWGGGTADGMGPAWSNSAVWNNAGDGASLLDGSGAIMDWVGYGAAPGAPTGFEARPIAPKPDKGLSIEIEDGTWATHTPTPGSAPGAVAGSLQFQVANIAPHAAFAGLPLAVKPGSTLAVAFTVGDGNGDADIRSWNLTSSGTVVAHGTGIPTQAVMATAPVAGAQWSLTVQAVDQAGLTGSATATLALRASDLAVTLPAGGIPLPALFPGAQQAAATQPVLVENLGPALLRPLLDVSPISGPASFPAEGHLEVGAAIGGNTTWIPYDAPLTPLPTLAPGIQMKVWFRIVQVPSPLPAGDYGTSFTVVAA
jgi:hypothetical protein